MAMMTNQAVICVPVYTSKASRMDALLSMCQRRQGIPTATKGFGSSGFSNAYLYALQILALNKPELKEPNKGNKTINKYIIYI